MRIYPRVLTSAAALAITCAVSAAAYFYKRRNVEINEVMVFCKLQFNAYGCFDQLMSYVEAAKKSISVCMPAIQNPAIQGRLVALMKEKNIKVRIMLERSGYDITDFLLKDLIDLGAEVKCYCNLPFQMYHKFCIVDDKVLMTGTLNWGNDRSSDHWNYVYITSKKPLVQPVNDQFNIMWNHYSMLGHEHSTEHLSTNETEGIHRDPNEIESEDETHTDELNVSGVTEEMHPVTDIPKCFHEDLTFRQTVMTPEVTITT